MSRNLVLLHGFTHTGASWDPVVASLGESYRALAPDIRGHGRAGALRPVGIEAVIGDLELLTEPHESFTVVGYSMGGRIALHVALAPGLADRVERLVLIGASPGLADAAERAERRAADEALADELERTTIQEFAVHWARTPLLAGQPAEVLQAAHDDRLRNTPAGLAAALRGLGTGALPSLWDRLGELSVPVTVIVGERDPKFTEIAGRMASAIRDAHVAVVPRAGHAVHLEAPAAAARELTRFASTPATPDATVPEEPGA
jgi:2-succinyl-6-hydroxy-2,4-cyclohexadiene-1-carboxylate synthase